jgi:hypothetical protein
VLQPYHTQQCAAYRLAAEVLQSTRLCCQHLLQAVCKLLLLLLGMLLLFLLLWLWLLLLRQCTNTR